MIIPDLHADKGIIVGISGAMFAGKTTAAQLLEREGFAYTRISAVIDDVLRERGEEITRQNQQRVGFELHEQKGQRWLCRRAIERIPGEPTNIVVDGLRWPEDAAYFSERFGGRFHHIHLEAPFEIRRERAVHDGRVEEFDAASGHAVESGVAMVAMIADTQIMNDCDMATLEARLREWAIPEQGATSAS